jgi:hypothetical protein
VKLAESPSYGQSIFDYAPKSNGAEDYMSLADEVRPLLGRLKFPVEETTSSESPEATPVSDDSPKPRRVRKAPRNPAEIAAAPQESPPGEQVAGPAATELPPRPLAATA